jgi:hypothetical protein
MQISFGSGLDVGVGQTDFGLQTFLTAWDSITGIDPVRHSAAITAHNGLGIAQMTVTLGADWSVTFQGLDDQGQTVVTVTGSLSERAMGGSNLLATANRIISDEFSFFRGTGIDFRGSQFDDDIDAAVGQRSSYQGLGGNDTMTTYGGVRLFGGAGDDRLEALTGEDSYDNGRTVLSGGRGNDSIWGHYPGRLIVDGGGGDDAIDIEAYGTARATGGGGADSFVIRPFSTVTITDFARQQDDLTLYVDDPALPVTVSRNRGDTVFTTDDLSVRVLDVRLTLDDVTLAFV